MALPPAASFIPPFSTDTSLDSVSGLSSDSDGDVGMPYSSAERMSRRANPLQAGNTYPENEDMTSADDEGDEPEDEADDDEGDDGLQKPLLAVRRGGARVAVNKKDDSDEDDGSDGDSDDQAIPGVEEPRVAPRPTSTRLSSEIAAPPTSTTGERMLDTGSSAGSAGGGVGSGYSSSAEDS
jgi:hypothetical protein